MQKNKGLCSALLLSYLLLPTPSFASINFDKIASEVRHFLGEQLTHVYCMVKGDCDQRVIYVMNLSQRPVGLNGCHFSDNDVLAPHSDIYSTQKNNKGHGCELTLTKDGEIVTDVNLSPKEHQISYIKQTKTVCLTEHRVLKSWKKCPWVCGDYKVYGYIAGCIVG